MDQAWPIFQVVQPGMGGRTSNGKSQKFGRSILSGEVLEVFKMFLVFGVLTMFEVLEAWDRATMMHV